MCLEPFVKRLNTLTASNHKASWEDMATVTSERLVLWLWLLAPSIPQAYGSQQHGKGNRDVNVVASARTTVWYRAGHGGESNYERRGGKHRL